MKNCVENKNREQVIIYDIILLLRIIIEKIYVGGNCLDKNKYVTA